MARVKRLRAAILPEMVTGDLTEADRAARWRHLADVYLVQQLHCYPGDYMEIPAPEHMLETVERYEEDLTDAARRISRSAPSSPSAMPLRSAPRATARRRPTRSPRKYADTWRFC